MLGKYLPSPHADPAHVLSSPPVGRSTLAEAHDGLGGVTGSLIQREPVVRRLFVAAAGTPGMVAAR